MSYEKQTWQTGDVVTSAKLNHMEAGIAGGGGALVVAVSSGETMTCDKTAAEMWAAYASGGVILYQISENTGSWSPVIEASRGSGPSVSYEFTAYYYGSLIQYTASADDGYPEYENLPG